MSLRKTAIAIPEDLLEAVDRAAEARQQSRNRFIMHVLRIAVRARRDAEITRRLDECFADPELASAHRTDADMLDAAGTDWHDERW
jgi:metal-responsive CopG/Arc/MetJ family transcriptional regulator